MAIASFRDLRVWQQGLVLVEQIYLFTKTFPKDETFGLVSQLRRAAISVPSNIAEGHARQHSKEYLQHLSIAQASLAELETQIEIARLLKYLSAEKAMAILDHSASLGKQLHTLRKALLKKHRQFPAPNP